MLLSNTHLVDLALDEAICLLVQRILQNSAIHDQRFKKGLPLFSCRQLKSRVSENDPERPFVVKRTGKAGIEACHAIIQQLDPREAGKVQPLCKPTSLRFKGLRLEAITSQNVTAPKPLAQIPLCEEDGRSNRHI